MSNKLFFAGLATVAMVATSLVNVASSQAQVAVGGGTQTVGSYPGGIQSGASSTALSSGRGTGAISGSTSFASPYVGGSTTMAGANAGSLFAIGNAASGVSVGRFGTSALAGAGALNNGFGTSFGASGTTVLSAPGFSNAAAGASFGSMGF
jgi:hypothetical protein